jgi:hypothetical protein
MLSQAPKAQMFLIGPKPDWHFPENADPPGFVARFNAT